MKLKKEYVGDEPDEFLEEQLMDDSEIKDEIEELETTSNEPDLSE